jgi:hypothetical protein
MPKEKRNRSQPVGLPAVPSSGYRALLTDIKARIRVAQIKASLSVNRELIQLYWDIGGLIVNRQRAEGWGKSVVEKLASDVQKEFPGIEGFSPRNIWRMRAFYLAWAHSEPVLLAVGEKNRKKLPRAVADLGSRGAKANTRVRTSAERHPCGGAPGGGRGNPGAVVATHCRSVQNRCKW